MPDSSFSGPAAGTLIAIGASSRRNFLYRLVKDARPAFGHVVLIEPDEAEYHSLSGQFAGIARTEIITAAIGDRDGQAELLQYNFPDLVSLHPPSDVLRRLLPGLRIRASKVVPMLSGASLKAQLADVPRPLTLALCAPGSEPGILRGLQEADLLKEIQTLRIRCGAEAFFETSSARSDIRRWLEARYFTLYGTDTSDPDWPEIRFRPDETALELDIMRAEKDALAKAQAAQDKLYHDLQDQIAERESRMAEQETDKLRALQDQIAERDVRLAEQQPDLSLALRMQAIAQADLEDLRQKYREGQEIRARQEDLLRQLTTRLHQAARQLRTIAPDPAGMDSGTDQLDTPDTGPAWSTARKPVAMPGRTKPGKPADDG